MLDLAEKADQDQHSSSFVRRNGNKEMHQNKTFSAPIHFFLCSTTLLVNPNNRPDCTAVKHHRTFPSTPTNFSWKGWNFCCVKRYWDKVGYLGFKLNISNENEYKYSYSLSSNAKRYKWWLCFFYCFRVKHRIMFFPLKLSNGIKVDLVKHFWFHSHLTGIS